MWQKVNDLPLTRSKPNVLPNCAKLSLIYTIAYRAFFFFFLNPWNVLSASEYPPSPVKPLTSERPQEWHIKWIHSSAFFQCRLKSRIFLWTSEKPSERHGTCTHSPSLSPSFERMTATSQRVKNLKPYLADCFFFFSLFAERRNSGILQTSQNSLYFPCCLCSLCCYPLKAQHDPPPPWHFVVIFNIKYPLRDYLMLLAVYSSLRLHGSY